MKREDVVTLASAAGFGANQRGTLLVKLMKFANTIEERSEAVSAEDADEMTISQALQWASRNATGEVLTRLRSRRVAKALSDEVHKLRALLAAALEELTCCDGEDVFEESHRCGRCDDYVDRNGTVRTEIVKALSR